MIETEYVTEYVIWGLVVSPVILALLLKYLPRNDKGEVLYESIQYWHLFLIPIFAPLAAWGILVWIAFLLTVI